MVWSQINRRLLGREGELARLATLRRSVRTKIRLCETSLNASLPLQSLQPLQSLKPARSAQSFQAEVVWQSAGPELTWRKPVNWSGTTMNALTLLFLASGT